MSDSGLATGREARSASAQGWRRKASGACAERGAGRAFVVKVVTVNAHRARHRRTPRPRQPIFRRAVRPVVARTQASERVLDPPAVRRPAGVTLPHVGGVADAVVDEQCGIVVELAARALK